MARPRKVIIIGSTGYKQANSRIKVECYLWGKIEKIVNIRDYDTVILNLLSLSDKKVRSTINWESFDSTLNIITSYEILSHGGEIIIVGDPRFRIPRHQTTDMRGKETFKETPFLLWTGFKFHWDKDPGDTVSFVDDYRHRKLVPYIKKLNKWDYSLYRLELNHDILKIAYNYDVMRRKNYSFTYNVDLFCTNRYNNGLAFIVRLLMLRGSRALDREYGPIVFLPQIDASDDEMITMILCDICGVEASMPEPKWLENYTAPGEPEVNEKISDVENEIIKSFDNLKNLKKRREQVRTCLKLLYERKKGLEPVVREILRMLGAEVEDPDEPNKEEDWITVKIKDVEYEGVLEVKSTGSEQFSEDGIRQLLEWVNRGIVKRKKKYKGIFIGNSCVEETPNKRPWPFSDSWKKSAELSDICAIRTIDLYKIYLLYSERKIDIESFWEDVFNTKGIFSIDKYKDSR
jgi:hypothetical protein